MNDSIPPKRYFRQCPSTNENDLHKFLYVIYQAEPCNSHIQYYNVSKLHSFTAQIRQLFRDLLVLALAQRGGCPPHGATVVMAPRAVMLYA